MSRVVARFSCGAASAVAAKIAIDAHGEAVWLSDDEPLAKFIVATDENGLRKVVTVLHVEDDAEPEIDGVDPEELRNAMVAQRGRRG